MFSPIPEILDEVRAGRFIVLVDDEDRENEGDLVLAAQFATPEKVQAIQRLAGGYLCLSLTEADCDRLALHPQAGQNTSVRGTPFTVSIDGHPKHGVGTGVSAFDRAKTIALAIDPATSAGDFVRPGHINPLRSRDGGVLVRIGQTEGAVDLARLAGVHPSALLIEIVREDGQMARRPDLERMCAANGWKMCSIEQLIAYRLERDTLVRRLPPVGGMTIETEAGAFSLIAYQSVVDPLPQLALTVGGVGDLDGAGRVKACREPTLVRMHRRNLLGDVFGDVSSTPEGASRRSLMASMKLIQREGRGVIVYLRPEASGDGLDRRIAPDESAGAWRPPTRLDAPKVPMHLREFGIGGQILRDLGLSRLRLLSNHPKALPGLDAFGLEIVEHVGLHLDESP
ncbi:MAG: 3,4-dihydroxy-2-butanone-4-phosphate synthase [Phycisphaerae bacterium]|nr:3,4-dihydroxy-2-butanone-4-phosphate synthase [Phycisphaerae bacterium]